MQGPEPINLSELPDKIRPLAPPWAAFGGLGLGPAKPARRRTPGPFFAAKKGAKKPPAPLCRGLDPEQYEGFTGVFCAANLGSALPRQGDAPSGQNGGAPTPPVGLLTRWTHLIGPTDERWWETYRGLLVSCSNSQIR